MLWGGHSCPPSRAVFLRDESPASRVLCREGGEFGLPSTPANPPARPCVHCVHPVLCWPHHWGSDSQNRHAALTARFLLLFALVGTFASARAGSHGCASARLLPSQGVHQCHGSGPESDQRTIRDTSSLQPRLLPRRDHIPVRRIRSRPLTAWSPRVYGDSRRRIDSRHSARRPLLLRIHPRSPAHLHRLTVSHSLRTKPGVAAIAPCPLNFRVDRTSRSCPERVERAAVPRDSLRPPPYPVIGGFHALHSHFAVARHSSSQSHHWLPSPISTAPVRGIVHDPQHRPVQGAMVMLKAKSSDWGKSVNTDANGEFQFNGVPLGDYSVSVASPGFAQTAQDVTVISGTVPVVHFQLHIAAENAKVTVSAASEVVPTDSATPITLVDQLDIARTPGADRSNSLAMITDLRSGILRHARHAAHPRRTPDHLAARWHSRHQHRHRAKCRPAV